MKEDLSRRKIWFKAKSYGWGWYPASWEGWLVVLGYLGLLLALFLRIDARSHSGSDTLIAFAPFFILATVTLVAVCSARGEPARWRWGRRRR